MNEHFCDADDTKKSAAEVRWGSALNLRSHNAAASRGPGADKAESPQLSPSAS